MIGLVIRDPHGSLKVIDEIHDPFQDHLMSKRLMRFSEGPVSYIPIGNGRAIPGNRKGDLPSDHLGFPEPSIRLGVVKGPEDISQFLPDTLGLVLAFRREAPADDLLDSPCQGLKRFREFPTL